MKGTAFALSLCLTLSASLYGQKNVDLKLKLSATQDLTSCFDIQLRSPDGQDINVAGQNYRIFYDANNMTFLEDRISHKLDDRTYSKLDVIKSEDNNIGFVSISIDSRILSDKGIRLSRRGEWVNSLNVCFQQDARQPYDLTWANRKKTSQFATAEVAMSEWVNAERQQILIPNELYDFSSLNSEILLNEDVVINVFPNPVVDFVNIVFSRQVEGEVLIKDIIGRQVVLERLGGDLEKQYQLNGWPEGSYTVMVLDREGKLIKSQNIVKISR